MSKERVSKREELAEKPRTAALAKKAKARSKKTRQGEVLSVLRSLADDLWKAKRSKERVTEEFLELLLKHFRVSIKALPLITAELRPHYEHILYELISHLPNSLPGTSATMLPFYARLANTLFDSGSFGSFCFHRLFAQIRSHVIVGKSTKKSDEKEESEEGDEYRPRHWRVIKELVRVPSDPKKGPSVRRASVFVLEHIRERLVGENFSQHILSSSDASYLTKSPVELCK